MFDAISIWLGLKVDKDKMRFEMKLQINLKNVLRNSRHHRPKLFVLVAFSGPLLLLLFLAYFRNCELKPFQKLNSIVQIKAII